MIATIETQGIPEPGVLERWENEGGSTRCWFLASHELSTSCPEVQRDSPRDDPRTSLF